MAQGGLIFALVFGLIAVASAALAGSPGTCAASCTGWCDWSNNCCTLPSNCAAANCANSTACTKTVCTACNSGYSLDATTKGCCSLTGTSLTNLCTAATCDANGANVRCTACVAGYYVNAGVCTVCTQARCTTVATCDAAGAGTRCTTCTAPAVLANDGKCCNAITNCATYTSCAADGTAPVCATCAAGYVLVSGACTACPANANCLTGQANLRCTSAAGPSTCAACPVAAAGPPVVDNSVLSFNGECCKEDASKNCGASSAAVGTTAAVFGIKSCTPVAVAAPGTGFTYTVVCNSCKTSTLGPISGATAGTAFWLDTSNVCQSCTAATGGYEHDVLCATWGCTSATESTNMCLTCPTTGNTALSVDKKCGPAIAGCEQITTVEFVEVFDTATPPVRTAITTYSRCGTATAPKCKPGFVYVAGGAIGATPSSDVCTACTVPSTAANCAAGSCTALPSTGFACTLCNTGFYLSGTGTAATCVAYTTCVAGTNYLTFAGNATANAVCTPCSSCATGQFVAKTCTASVDTICAPCKVPCDNCAASTCLGGCNTCSNNYVFTSTATVCELACGNGNINTGEQCDETVSGQCVNCQCNAGFYPNSAGVCTDIDECAAYTCAFNSDENVECTTDAPNTRTCTCLNEKTIRSSTESSITLEGAEYFNGCNDADLSEEEFIQSLADNTVPLEWLFELLGASVDNVEVDSEDERTLFFTINWANDADALTTTEAANAIKTWLFELFGIALADSQVTVVASAKRAVDYTVSLSLSETATDSAATFAPIMSVVAVLLMLIR